MGAFLFHILHLKEFLVFEILTLLTVYLSITESSSTLL